MLATTELFAVDAYPGQSEAKVHALGRALPSAMSALFEDSRTQDLLFADMIEGMFERGRTFTVADMNRLRLALASCCAYSGKFRNGKQSRDASALIESIMNVEPFHSDAFETVHAAAQVYMQG